MTSRSERLNHTRLVYRLDNLNLQGRRGEIGYEDLNQESYYCLFTYIFWHLISLLFPVLIAHFLEVYSTRNSLLTPPKVL